MQQNARSIFVLEAGDDSALAFAADDLATAEQLCRATWFNDAVDAFRAHRGQTISEPYSARPASVAEAALYRRIADEFADVPNGLFVAPLAGGQNTAECVFQDC